MNTTTTSTQLNVPKIVQDILDSIEKEREKEIISRRFGLSGRKETLEEIGQLLGITRERVRQIEKQTIIKLTTQRHPHLDSVSTVIGDIIEELGSIVPLKEIAQKLDLADQAGHAQVSFVAKLAPGLEVVSENDHFHHTVLLEKHHNSIKAHNLLKELTETIRKINKPSTIKEIHSKMPSSAKVEEHHIHALARAAKGITNLESKWGLISWPLVNPKSIRDKIFVILQKHGKPMHFNQISEAIKGSDFKRKDVTTQAIHNELIKDDRFVLVGRGIYALSEWGYTKGTVADVISEILKEQSPLHRDEIVKLVLKQRHVKPTTIILNLQGKNQFKRVAKATYALA
jgi:hypothetical protein